MASVLEVQANKMPFFYKMCPKKVPMPPIYLIGPGHYGI